MSLADRLQIFSLLVVAVALILNFFQNRQIARQTHEMSHQSRASIRSLEQTAYQMLVSSDKEIGISLLSNDPEMLRWHLTVRGYPVSTDEANKRYHYLLFRLNMHEANYLSHSAELLADDLWLPWHRVLVADVKVPEFEEVWSNARNFFATSFVAHVDQLLDGRPVAPSVATVPGELN